MNKIQISLQKKIKDKIYNILKEKKLEKEKYNWKIQGRPEQQEPEGSWRVWLILAGRGFGKTRTGAETIRQWATSGRYKNIALIAETEHEARSVMIEGESGILSVHHPEEQPRFEMSQKRLVWPNGAQATIYSSENYEKLRGPQFDGAWIDEFAKYRDPQSLWEQLNFCLRLGEHPRTIITTTPRPLPLLKKMMSQKDEGVVVTQGNTFQNRQNLSSEFLSYMEDSLSHSSLGRQELWGEIIDKQDNTLWTWDMIQGCQESHMPAFERVIMAIDPAVTCTNMSDETGIIVAGRYQNKIYILGDYSGKFSISQWGEKIPHIFNRHKIHGIVVEVNQGGDFLTHMLKQICPFAPIYSVRAIQSKWDRAIPISALYHQKKVFHYSGRLEILEKQMCEYTPGSRSPDRLDALVWAVHHLFSCQQKNVSIESIILQ
jgi:phage terminase large subunit-like protein